jgi:hypothetical protein
MQQQKYDPLACKLIFYQLVSPFFCLHWPEEKRRERGERRRGGEGERGREGGEDDKNIPLLLLSRDYFSYTSIL